MSHHRHRRALASRLLIGLTALMLAPTAWAQITIEITGGAIGATPIALVPFRVAEGTPEPETDLAGIIGADLGRTGFFDPLPRANFISRPGNSTEVRFANWRTLGADYLVVGGIRAAGDGQLEVRFELLDIYGQRVVEGVGKRYTVSPSNLRSTAHTIANEVFEALTGNPGGFNTRILYVQVEGTGENRRYRLMYAHADGHNPQAILTSDQPILSPAWGPDRERIAYVSFEDGRSEIYVQRVATGERRKVASFPGINSAPAFSPDGERLALTLSRGGNTDIHVLDLESGNLQRVTDAYGIDTEAVWTPNGRSLVFTSDRGGSPQIYRVPATGGAVERLTFEGDYNASPDLSPDGRFLSMVTRGRDGFGIAVQDLENGLVRTLTNGGLDESPTFAPNGAMVLYTRIRDGRSELATVSVHGRAEDALRRFDSEVREPAWSPL